MVPDDERASEREVAGRGYITRPVVLVRLSVLIEPVMYSNGASNMAAAPTSVVVMDRGNNTTCTINLHGLFACFSQFFSLKSAPICSVSLPPFFLNTAPCASGGASVVVAPFGYVLREKKQ